MFGHLKLLETYSPVSERILQELTPKNQWGTGSSSYCT